MTRRVTEGERLYGEAAALVFRVSRLYRSSHSPNYFSKSQKSEEKARLLAVYIGLTDI